MVLLHQPPPVPTFSPVEGGTDRGAVMWRSWVIAPEHRPQRRPTVVLTGLFGFPWATASLHAKCTAGRHHRIVPDPRCSCGIYGCSDVEAVPGQGVLPIGRPVAHGFVALDGPALTTGRVTRAQRAAIVGPLLVAPGRPSATVRALQRVGALRQPATVVDDGDGFRVTWGRASVGTPYDEWRTWAAEQLSERYGVTVL